MDGRKEGGGRREKGLVRGACTCMVVTLCIHVCDIV